jgi:hypothetical protein
MLAKNLKPWYDRSGLKAKTRGLGLPVLICVSTLCASFTEGVVMRRALAVVAVASCVFVFQFPSMVQAATFTWGTGVSGNWSSGPNWSPSGAPSVAATSSFLFGNGDTAWSSTDDIAGSFPVNNLTFTGNGGGALSSAVASNVLNFVSSGSTTPTIT